MPNEAEATHAGAQSQRPAPRADDVRIAAIGIGSNSIRQIVADVSPEGEIRVIDEMKAAPRLGERVGETGRIGEAAIRNALDALLRMATLTRQMGAVRTEAVATSAVRDAANGAEFIAAVRDTTGLTVRILDGDQEALLSYRSALAHFDLATGRAVVMDIGGGSLELALSADGLLDGLMSFPMGAITMTEQFFHKSRGRKELAELRRFARKELRATVSRRDWHGARLIGSGGTFTNLAGMILSRQGMGRASGVHGTIVTRAELEHVLDLLQGMSPSERQTVPGLSPARADIIVAGLAVAAEVMARIEARDLVVSAYGIREGLLLEAASITPAVADPGEARSRAVMQLAERSHYEAPHAQQVRRIALEIFDALAAKLELGPSDRAVLADAALLHDIGYHINFEAHHKHSYHLILHAELLGMTPAERVMVANVARYHRGAAPTPQHRAYAGLDRQLRRRIKRLAAILRVADGLDRGHASAVKDVDTELTRTEFVIRAIPASSSYDLRLELWGATRKCELLEEVLGVPVRIESA
ncbi:MAG TPA: Ppx/GppA phosphatase family protein [Gemmatimonadaceae bacterium]|nr:Ppx/GppA phosphatase family protein [Gemmatimonadaceae bacterium]